MVEEDIPCPDSGENIFPSASSEGVEGKKGRSFKYGRSSESHLHDICHTDGMAHPGRAWNW